MRALRPASLLGWLGVLALFPAAHMLRADDIFQIANSGADWNSADYWGSAATSGNNYFSTPSGDLRNEFTTNGITWSFTTGIGTVRDNLSGSGSFAGDSLTLLPTTRLLGKVSDGGTSTVNLIFSGGFYMSGANTAGSAILAGTIRFESGTDLAAIAVNRGQTTALTVSSTLIGDSSDTLQLTLFTESSIIGGSSIVFTGDLSNFAGTLYVGTSTTGNGSNPSSFYSVHSSSASATLNIDTVSFAVGENKYHLDNDVTFGSLIVGGSTLEAGAYDADALNLAAGGVFFTGDGTITVVPEPSAVVLCLMGAVLFFARGCWRRGKSAAS